MGLTGLSFFGLAGFSDLTGPKASLDLLTPLGLYSPSGVLSVCTALLGTVLCTALLGTVLCTAPPMHLHCPLRATVLCIFPSWAVCFCTALLGHCSLFSEGHYPSGELYFALPF